MCTSRWNNYFIRVIINPIIKLLGGYTSKEYIRVEQKYKALKDSKTDNKSAQIANSAILEIFQDLDKYMQSIDGIWADTWCKKVYNIIKNNMYRVMIRYVHSGSTIIYSLDTTLDGKDDFKKVLEDDKDYDEIEYMLSGIVEND